MDYSLKKTTSAFRIIFIIGGILLLILFSLWVGDSGQTGITLSPIEQTKDTLTAEEIISGSRLGSIRRVFPDEMLDKTLEEIEKMAEQKGETGRKAKKAAKLLKDGRFKKN